MAGWSHIVKRHIALIKKHHLGHKRNFLQVFHAIRRHPGAYMAGYRPSRAAMPKSLPRKPAGLHKEASGLWDWAKKGWSWVKSKFNAHKGAIMDQAKKHASAAARHVGSRVGDAAKRVGSRVVDKIQAVADRNIEHYVDKAEGKLESLGKKAEAKIAKWDKKKVDHMPGKTGSGVIGAKTPPWMLRQMMANAQRGMTIGQATGLGRRKTPGVFSRKFKRRTSAAVRAFRSSR